MFWEREDWDPWLKDVPTGSIGQQSHEHAFREILSRVPGREHKTIAELGCGTGSRLPFLAAKFARVVAVEQDPAALTEARKNCDGMPIEFVHRDPAGLGDFRQRFHAVLAVESMVGPTSSDLVRALRDARNSLVEGGILLATFPSNCHLMKGPFPMQLGLDNPAPPQFHELELQYRLHRAGFQGPRIRRFRGEAPPKILCLAVARVSN